MTRCLSTTFGITPETCATAFGICVPYVFLYYDFSVLLLLKGFSKFLCLPFKHVENEMIIGRTEDWPRLWPEKFGEIKGGQRPAESMGCLVSPMLVLLSGPHFMHKLQLGLSERPDGYRGARED